MKKVRMFLVLTAVLLASAAVYGYLNLTDCRCQTGTGGYGYDGDTRCCPAGQTWKSATKTCQTANVCTPNRITGDGCPTCQLRQCAADGKSWGTCAEPSGAKWGCQFRAGYRFDNNAMIRMCVSGDCGITCSEFGGPTSCLHCVASFYWPDDLSCPLPFAR